MLSLIAFDVSKVVVGGTVSDGPFDEVVEVGREEEVGSGGKASRPAAGGPEGFFLLENFS